MEAGPPIDHRLGVFCDLPVQIRHRLIPVDLDGVPGTDGDAASAAHAAAVVDVGLPLRNGQGAVGADPGTHPAAHAVFMVHMGLSGVVLLHLPGPAAAAHADVFQSAAEARLLMALEVGQGDEHVGIHDGPTDLGLLHQLTAHHRHSHLVAALDAVCDDDLTSRGHGVESVETRRIQMIQPILPSPYIQGVAVGEEGLATPLLHEICHRLGPVGPQEGQIARFTKVHFDGHELPVEIDLAHPGGFHEAGQLLLEILVEIRPQICPINF